MKTISLIGSHLLQYFRFHKLLLFLYLFSSVFCGVGMLYLYGSFTTLMRERHETFASMRTFGLEFDEETAPLIGEIEKVIDEFEDKLSACYVVTIDDYIQQMVESPIWGESPVHYMGKPVVFMGRAEERMAVIPVVLFGDLTELNQERTILTLRGESLEIVGRSSSFRYIIPIGIYRKLGYPLNSIRFVLKDKPSRQMEREMVPLLQQRFPKAQIQWPRADKQFAREQLPLELSLICLVYAVSLFSFAYLLKYLLDQHIPENVVYSLVGAQKGKVIRLILLENLLLSSFSALLSIGLHLLLKESVLDRVSVSAQLTYQLSDYLLLFLLMVVVSQLVSLPFILRYRRQTIMAVRHTLFLN